MEVVRSRERRRTASAGVRGGEVVVRVPAHTSAAEAQVLVSSLVEKMRRRVTEAPPAVPGLADRVAARDTGARPGPRGDCWLVALADEVGHRWLDGQVATNVAWSGRMTTRWASCTVPTARIRVSTRLADAPTAVIAHILLHELAHLRVRGHGPAFRALLARDPLAAAVDDWLTRRSALETAAALRRDGLLDPRG